jgi:hypothetical protein
MPRRVPWTSELTPGGRLAGECQRSGVASSSGLGWIGGADARDATGPRVAARTAAALAQTTAQLVGTGTLSDILERLSRHVVDGTRALACAISVVSDDYELGSAGAYVRGYGAAEPRQSDFRSFTRY